MVSMPTYDNNVFSGGIDSGRVPQAPQRPAEAARQPRDQRPVPAGLDVQARRRDGRARGRQDHAADPNPHCRLPEPRRVPLPRLERRGLRRVQHLLRLRPLERHVLLPGGGDARHRSPRLLGRSSTASAGRPGSTCPPRSAGSSPRTSGRSTTFGLPIYPGEVYLAGIGQGYDAVTPLQLLNAYATLANGGTRYEPHVVKEIIGPDGTVTEVEPEVVLEHKAPASHVARDAPRRPQRAGHPPHLQPRRPADRRGRQDRHRRVRRARPERRLPVPQLVRELRAQGPVEEAAATRTASRRSRRATPSSRSSSSRTTPARSATRPPRSRSTSTSCTSGSSATSGCRTSWIAAPTTGHRNERPASRLPRRRPARPAERVRLALGRHDLARLRFPARDLCRAPAVLRPRDGVQQHGGGGRRHLRRRLDVPRGP